MTTRPALPYRILRCGGEPTAIYYLTKEARDAAAASFAAADGAKVLTELWDETHTQDQLNQGWACDGGVEPPRPPAKEKSPAKIRKEARADAQTLRMIAVDVQAAWRDLVKLYDDQEVRAMLRRGSAGDDPLEHLGTAVNALSDAQQALKEQAHERDRDASRAYWTHADWASYELVVQNVD